MRRAGLNVEIVSVTPDEIVVGAHDVSVLCDINFENCDFFDAELLLLPGGMPGAATLDKHEGLRKLILDFAAKVNLLLPFVLLRWCWVNWDC